MKTKISHMVLLYFILISFLCTVFSPYAYAEEWLISGVQYIDSPFASDGERLTPQKNKLCFYVMNPTSETVLLEEYRLRLPPYLAFGANPDPDNLFGFVYDDEKRSVEPYSFVSFDLIVQTVNDSFDHYLPIEIGLYSSQQPDIEKTVYLPVDTEPVAQVNKANEDRDSFFLTYLERFLDYELINPDIFLDAPLEFDAPDAIYAAFSLWVGLNCLLDQPFVENNSMALRVYSMEHEQDVTLVFLSQIIDGAYIFAWYVKEFPETITSLGLIMPAAMRIIMTGNISALKTQYFDTMDQKELIAWAEKILTDYDDGNEGIHYVLLET